MREATVEIGVSWSTLARSGLAEGQGRTGGIKQMNQLHPATKALALVLALVGAVALVVGIVYLAVPAHSLPSFFPAHTSLKHDTLHATKHGYAAVALAVVLLAAAVALPAVERRAQGDRGSAGPAAPAADQPPLSQSV
jgi:hypothetical protein